MTIQELYNKYRTERVVEIDEEQFSSFTVFFPALLVIISDGVVDMEEWEYIKQLSVFIAKSFKADGHEDVDIEQLSEAYRHEISYLIKHLRDWQEDFLMAVKDFLIEHPEAKSYVLETMELFADASEGTSLMEERRIDDLVKQLDLKNQ